MALSKPANITQDSLFSCPVCLETLKSPKILPCLHTFCEQCIHECILTKGRTKEKEVTEFSCPVCQTIVKPNDIQVGIDKWASGLQTNHALLTMMTVAQGDKVQECHPCKRHDVKSTAKYWCKECVEAFCEECNSKHGWIKFISSHDMVPIEDIGSNTSGIDLNAITNRCLEHPAKVVDSYCFDHKKLCCILCLLKKHKGCSNVKTIEEISESEQFGNARDALSSMKDAAIELLKSKTEQLNNFNLNIVNTEEEAAKLVQMLKCKLDNLFETFTKQLHIYQDEKATNLQIRIQLLSQLINNLDHWIHTAKVTDEFGTKSQLFIFTEMIKRQIGEAILELNKKCRNNTSCDIKFCENDLLQQLKTIDDIDWQNLGYKTFSYNDEITVQKVNGYCLKGTKLSCGVAIDNSQYIILGDRGSVKKLHLFDQITGSISNTTEFAGDVKRVCYVEKQNQVFVSCYSWKVFRAILSGKEISKPELVFDGDAVGALCPYEEYVYIVVNNAIKRFITTETQHGMTHCFKTNTECGLNGMDTCEDKLVYTTKNNEIKCTKVQGEQEFCFKDATIGAPKGLVVLPTGLVFVINQENEGSLHVLSKDGEKIKTVLKKFDDIKKPEDIWLDTDNETVYVVGGEYIEVYRITSD